MVTTKGVEALETDAKANPKANTRLLKRRLPSLAIKGGTDVSMVK